MAKNNKDGLLRYKWYLFPYYATVFVALFCGAIVSSLHRSNNNGLLILALIIYVAALIASIVLNFLIRIKIKNNKKLGTYYIFNVISAIILSYIVDMVIFRLLVLVNPNSIFNKSGLFSAIVSVIAILLLLGALFIKLEYLAFFRKKKKIN